MTKNESEKNEVIIFCDTIYCEKNKFEMIAEYISIIVSITITVYLFFVFCAISICQISCFKDVSVLFCDNSSNWYYFITTPISMSAFGLIIIGFVGLGFVIFILNVFLFFFIIENCLKIVDEKKLN